MNPEVSLPAKSSSCVSRYPVPIRPVAADDGTLSIADRYTETTRPDELQRVAARRSVVHNEARAIAQGARLLF